MLKNLIGWYDKLLRAAKGEKQTKQKHNGPSEVIGLQDGSYRMQIGHEFGHPFDNSATVRFHNV
jgi:hypothetical protein